MNNNSIEIQHSVIAILKTDNKLKAVELLKQNGAFKILWAKSSIENDLDWQTFAAECGLSTKVTQQEQVIDEKNVVVGYDSSGMAFYQVIVPAVEEKEVSSIVHLQAESRFPLPADQMELAWRTSKAANRQMAITIAAARKQTVQNFIDKVRTFGPEKAILDSEGIVKVWKELFSGREQNVVIVNAGTHNTQICLAENGLLCNAVTLDMGTVDFGESESQEDTESIERLVRDIRSVVDLFGLETQFEIPVVVLSDGSKIYRTLAASLKSIGLNARSEVPSIEKLNPDNELDLKEIFEYRAPIGIALMALDDKTNELNLFEYLFKPFGEEVKKHWYCCPKITSVIATVMVFLFIMVSYAVVASGSNTINRKLGNLGSETTDILVEKQNLMREIAGQRADLVELLTEITKSGQNNPNSKNGPEASGQGGIQLESFHFKKKKQVTITGKAQKKEQLENFEKNLTGNKDFRDVHLIPKSSNGTNSNRNSGNKKNGNNPPANRPGNPGGSENKGFTFTVTFHYKNFTVGQRR